MTKIRKILAKVWSKHREGKMIKKEIHMELLHSPSLKFERCIFTVTLKSALKTQTNIIAIVALILLSQKAKKAPTVEGQQSNFKLRILILIGS